MKCKINIFSSLFAMIIAPLFFQSNANAQSDCSNAFAFSMDSVSQTYSINDSVLWMEFEADTNFVLFEVITHDTNYFVDNITLYSGMCGSLQQIATSTSSSFSSTNVVKNNLYKLKISLNGIYNGGIVVMNGSKTCESDAILTLNSSVICLGDYFEVDATLSTICQSHIYQWYYINTNFAYFINYSNYKKQIVPSQSGIYTIAFVIIDEYGEISDSAAVTVLVLDSATHFTHSPAICVSDTVFFQDSTHCPEPTSWQWDFGDGTSSTLQNPWHQYNQPGTYTVTLTTFPSGSSESKTIHLIAAEPAIISGSFTTCDSTVLYTIENYDTNYIYTWSTQIYDPSTNQYSSGSFVINGSGTVVSADSALIDWYSSGFPYLPEYALVNVEAKLKGTNCSDISTFEVYQCCDNSSTPGAYHWYDTIISQSLHISGGEIIINGIVRLQNNLIIDNNSYLWLGPYSKIILENNAILKIYDSDLKSGCEYMWDGIYADNMNEQIHVKSSRVYESINGFVSVNGALLYIDSTDFEANLHSIQVKNYQRSSVFQNPVTYQGHIRGCNFNVHSGNPVNTNAYNILLSPYSGEPSNCGVYVENVENVEIGDAYALKNTFNLMRFGIISKNSAIKVFNNEFRFIKDVTNNALYKFIQGAIYVSNLNTTLPAINYSKAMVIGKPGNYTNHFTNCHTAVYANNTIATVSNNSIDSCDVGIRLLDFKLNSRVDSNLIFYTTEGIIISKPIGSYRNIKVRENNFPYSSALRTGISIINVNSGTGDLAQIANNTIRFVGNSSDFRYGIITNNCNGIRVNSNYIGRGGVSLSDIANNWDKMVGIKTVQTKGCEITDNYIQSMGTGIWTNGSCNLTQYSCNDLITYKYGFYFGQQTTITEQGHLGTWNTHNKWSTSGAIAGNQQLATDVNYNNFNWTGTVKWYYGPNYISQYIPNQLNTVQPQILPYQNSTDNHYCVGTTTGTGTSTGGGSPTGTGTNSGTLAILEDEVITDEIRDFLFEDILEGLDYIDLLNEFRAYDARFLYEMLAEDTTLMWLGGYKDVNYQEFFDSVRMSNIGDFTKVYDLIEAEDYHRADSMNNLIEPTSNIYSNLKTVLSIYLNTWCKGVYHLSESDYNTLFEIANQTPYEGGDGVYTARIMINFNPDDYGVAFRLQPEKANNVDKDAIKLYPNPAQDILNIEFENPKGEEINGVLKVFNLSGQLIFEKQLNTNNVFYLLDINSLTNGAYIFSIQINNNENTAYRHQSGKLIVLKP